MSFYAIVLIFIVFRSADFLISYLTPYFIPYLGFFPYGEVLNEYNIPQFLRSFANFDGVHYLLIAKNGYTTYEQAFFPFYPLLIKFFWPIMYETNFLVGFIISLIISNISFFTGLYVFKKYLDLLCHPELGSGAKITRFRNKFGMTRNVSFWIILFLLLFPTSFFFGAVYTEGLFFFLLISSLFFLKKERYYLFALFAFFASLTRFIGVFLIIPVLFHFLAKKNLKFSIAFITPLLGLGLYSLYLWITYGDPLFFLNSQWAFGAHRTSSFILLPQVYFRYFKIFFTAAWNFQYFISLFEFITFTFVFIIVILNLVQDLLSKNQMPKQVRYDRLGLGIFSLINIVLPTLTGTLSSIPRYALFSLSFFLFLAGIKNVKVKIAIALIFAIFHIIILGFFIQGYFVS